MFGANWLAYVRRMTVAKPKIALVVSTALQVQFFLKPHLRALADRYDVTLFLPNDRPDLLAAFDMPVCYEIIPIVRPISPISDLRALLTLWSKLRKGRFASVHTVTPKAGLLGTLAGWAARIPVRVHTFQGEVWANSRGLKRAIFKALDRLVVLLTTHVMVVSHSELAYLRDERVLGPEQGEVLGQGSIGGVDLARFAADPTRRVTERAKYGLGDENVVALFLGRLNPDKGVTDLVAAFRMMQGDHPNARLLLVGPDEGAAPDATDGIIRAPFTAQPEMAVAAADYLVLPSHREGFGVVIIEAAAMGLPAIGCDIYGLKDAVVDGETGLLVPVPDPKALSDAMGRMTADSELRARLGAAALRRAKQEFSVATVVGAFIDYYARLPALTPCGSDRKDT